MDTALIGLSLGCVYALIALGFSLVYRTTGILNLSQGAFVMLSGVVTASLVSKSGLPLLPAVLLGILAAVGAGLVLALAIVLPLWRLGVSEFKTILATLIFALVAENVVLNAFGSRPLGVQAFSEGSYAFLGGRLTAQYLWIFGVTLTLVALALLVLRYTDIGLAMRAVAERPQVARTLGISPTRIAIVALATTAGIAGVAGVLIAPVQYASFSLAIPYTVKGFVAAVIGGFGSVTGALAGGVLLGVAEAYVAAEVSSTYQDVIVLSLLFVALLVRPQGLIPSGELH
jgi:branched-chain amino acid transport system permease protein